MTMALSVCMPYWNRQRLLDEMFANFAEYYADWPLEFSICDDGSPTPVVLPAEFSLEVTTKEDEGQRYQHSKFPEWQCVLTRLPVKHGAFNPCVPINRAVAASTGDIVVLTNPEILHTSPVLEEMLGLLQGASDYIMARCKHDGKGRIWLAGPDTNYRLGVGGREVLPPGGHFHFLVMLYRTLWRRADGFDESYRGGQACDDNDWLWRVYEAGAVFRCTEGMVWHRREGTEIAWKLPHNRRRFVSKWPEEKRLALIAERTRGEDAQ